MEDEGGSLDARRMLREGCSAWMKEHTSVRVRYRSPALNQHRIRAKVKRTVYIEDGLVKGNEKVHPIYE